VKSIIEKVKNNSVNFMIRIVFKDAEATRSVSSALQWTAMKLKTWINFCDVPEF
jgi:hypothetical protein